MKVLITGGSGFIGSHLAETLIEEDFRVTQFDIKYNENVKNSDCEKIKGDICHYKAISKAVQDKDIIVHLAAVSRVEWGQRDPARCLKVNAFGTFNLLEALRRNNPESVMIFGSSREVYGEPRTLPVREDHPKDPISVYGASKLSAENFATVYHRAYGLSYVILRFSNVYGSKRDLPERVVPKFMKQSLENKTLTVYGGQQLLDFTFIDDVIEGIVNTIKKLISRNETILNNDFNFATGKGTSIIELAKLIKEICNSNSEIEIKEKRCFDVSKFVGDYQKAKGYLGYDYKHSLRDGLRIYKHRLSAC